MYCKDCGSKMHIRTIRKDSGNRYVTYCSEYAKGKAKHPKCHSPHRIDVDMVMENIAEVLRKIARFALSNKAEFEAMVQSSLAREQTDEVKKLQKRLPRITHRLEQIDKVLNKLYEDNALGATEPDRYEQLSQKYGDCSPPLPHGHLPCRTVEIFSCVCYNEGVIPHRLESANGLSETSCYNICYILAFDNGCRLSAHRR